MRFHSHELPRFPRPPLSSRTVGFPESGWRFWPGSRPFPWRRKLKHWLAYTPHLLGLTTWLPNESWEPSTPVTAKRSSKAHRLCASGPANSESLFAAKRRYLSTGSLEGHLDGRCPVVFAHIGSCAEP